MARSLIGFEYMVDEPMRPVRHVMKLPIRNDECLEPSTSTTIASALSFFLRNRNRSNSQQGSNCTTTEGSDVKEIAITIALDENEIPELSNADTTHDVTAYITASSLSGGGKKGKAAADSSFSSTGDGQWWQEWMWWGR